MNEPVFTASRRAQAKGPGRGPLLGSIIALVLIAASVGAWLQWGGRGESPAEPVAEMTADSVQAEVETEEAAEAEPEVPPADTTPPPPPPVRLVVSVQPGSATVTVDDSIVATPDEGLMLEAGPHRVYAEAAGYFPLDTVVELVSDVSLTLALRRATGTVEVRANLAGQVLVDGRTPCASYRQEPTDWPRSSGSPCGRARRRAPRSRSRTP